MGRTNTHEAAELAAQRAQSLAQTEALAQQAQTLISAGLPAFAQASHNPRSLALSQKVSAMRSNLAKLESEELAAAASASDPAGNAQVQALEEELAVAQKRAESAVTEGAAWKKRTSFIAQSKAKEYENLLASSHANYEAALTCNDETAYMNLTLESTEKCLRIELQSEKDSYQMVTSNYKCLGRFKDNAQRACQTETDRFKREKASCEEVQALLRDSEHEVYREVCCTYDVILSNGKHNIKLHCG